MTDIQLPSQARAYSAMSTVIDLDGVVWLEGIPISGAAEAVGCLQGAGHDVRFVTNSSYFTRAEQEMRLAHCGIRAQGRVITSAMAAASLIEEGMVVLVVGGPGLFEEVSLAGGEIVDPRRAREYESIDAVVVGFTRAFDWEMLDCASAAVRNGARLIGSNGDPVYPTPEGLVPGGGAILAAVEAASQRPAVIAGKPHAPMVELVRELATELEGGWVIGDRLDTDGALAQALEWDFLLVFSGSTPVQDVPVRSAADLSEAVRIILADEGSSSASCC